MHGAIRFLLRHRVGVTLLIAAITALSLLSLSRARLATSVNQMFLGQSAAYARYLERVEVFPTDEALAVGWEDPALLSPASVARLRQAGEHLRALPDLDTVLGPLDVPRISAVDGTLTVDSYAEAAEASAPEAALAALRADPRARGLVVAEQGDAAALLVTLGADPARPAERGPAVVAEVKQAFVDAGYDSASLHFAGLLAQIAEMLTQTVRNLTVLFPLVLLMVIGTVWLSLRRLLPVLISTGVALLSVLWTMGLATAIDPDINIFMALVPAVILVVSISDVVHLWSAWQLEREVGAEGDEAILRAATDVGAACLLTSVTTGLGFLSMAAIPTPVYRHMGLILGFGVAVALLITVVGMPVLLSWLPPPARAAPRPKLPWLDRALGWTAELSTTRPWGVIAGFALFSLICLVGASRFTIETDVLQRLRPDTPIRQDADWFAANLAGTNLLEIYIDAPQEGGALEPALLERVGRYQAALETLPVVDRVTSAVDLLRELRGALRGEPVGPLPESREEVAQTLLLFELSGGAELDQLLDFDRSTLRLLARLNTTGLRGSYNAARDAEALARTTLGEDVTVEVTGLSSLYGEFLTSLISGQKTGLVLSFATVALMMILGLRSLRAGLWSMVPNALPLLALVGYVGWAWDAVDSDTLIVGMMAIGIGVDDTIHFLMRYRIEAARHARAEALRRSFAFAGRAIVFTTFILVIGFLPMALSDYFTVWILGTLLPGSLVVALVADLLLVPALVAVGAIRFDGPKDAGTDLA